MSMVDALILDFDGVVVDSEPVHFDCFRQVLARRGVDLNEDDYYARYIGFDDHDCFLHVMTDNSRRATEADIAAMTAEKTRLVQQAFAKSIRPLPGAIELMRAARQAGAAVAICSGALRDEILLAGRSVGALEYVDVIVAARDVRRGKPDPEGYLLAMRQLTEKRATAINPARTWVVEDAPAGIEAARKAGCKVLAVTNSYGRQALAAADKVVDSLTEVGISDLV